MAKSSRPSGRRPTHPDAPHVPVTPTEYADNFAEVFAHKIYGAGKLPLTDEERLMVVGKVCAALGEACHMPGIGGELTPVLDSSHDTLFSLRESIRRLTLPGKQLTPEHTDSIIRIAERSDHTARTNMQQFRHALTEARAAASR